MSQGSTYPYCDITTDLQLAFKDIEDFAGWDTLTGFTLIDEIISDSDQIIFVAKSGYKYNSIQSAIDSITDAASDKIYTLFVFPGEYDEAITLKDYVDIIAFNPFNTYILRQVTDNGVPVHCNLRINIDNRQIGGSHGLYLTAASVIHIEGNVKGANASLMTCGHGIYNASTGTVIASNGNITGGRGIGVVEGHGIYNASTGTVIASNVNIIGGAIHSYGIYNASTGIVAVSNSNIKSYNYPIGGGNVTLINCTLFSTGNKYAIKADTPQNVKCMNVWANTDLHSNITNLIPGGFNVDSEVSLP